MKEEPTCKTGIKKNVINKKTFDREMELCHLLSKENKGGCGWGKAGIVELFPCL
ncbi:MAG: hypothetical protein PHF35_00380 [Candidatus Moranbacteria bacterium]|nr:hypothetical protein [Candidatus Moranbacteria bacterium]